jgi:conjugal transfer/type IV secretion protein DotA/TraY
MGKLFKIIIGLLLPSIVMAQSGPFTPPTDDVSIKVLNQIFGSLLNGGNDAFGNAIATFNSAVLIIGGILATYTILAGTLGTAHDGEMLGKKFSSVWIPIRYSLGTALVLPVLSKGYCIAQALLMWLVVQGSGLGDMVWSAYMQTPGVAANIAVNENTKISIRELAENAFMAQLCIEANKASINISDSILTFTDRYDYSRVYDATNRAYNFGDQKGLLSTFTKTNCGQIKLADAIPSSTVASGPATTNNGYLGPLDSLFSPTDVSSINTAQETATKTMIGSMETLAKSVAIDDSIDATKATNYYAQIDSAVNQYLTTIQSAAQAVANTPSAATTSAQKYGWMLAGAYFMNTIVTNNKITSAMAAIPDSSFSKSQPMSGAKGSFANGFKVLAVKNPIYGTSGDAARAEGKAEDAKEDSQLGFGGPMMNAITRGLTSIDLYQLKNDTRHPVIIINEMGRRLQAYWIGMIVALFAVASAAAIASLIKASIASSVSNFLLIVIGFLGVPILTLGVTSFTASYLIPMLPFMMWLGVISGWLIAATIGILAAPLWAIMHLHPNGDDLTGRGGNGYMMVLGLLLRPALAIFGFIFAVTVSSVMGEFINKIYFQVFSFSQGDGKGLGFFLGMIAGTAIYCAIMFSFVKKCFSMMHVIPDEMLKWIGGGSDNLGHYAGKMGEGSLGSAQAVGGFIAGRGITQGVQNLKNNIGAQKDASDRKKEAEKQKKLGSEKQFNEQTEKWDEKFGIGEGSKISSMLGLDNANMNSESSQRKIAAFEKGSKLANDTGGGEGAQAFVEKMYQASQNGFSEYNDSAAKAAESISTEISTDNLTSKIKENYGVAGSAYLEAAISENGGGKPDINTLSKTSNELGKAQKMLGNSFSAVLTDAVVMNPGDAQGMRNHIGMAYSKAKMDAETFAGPQQLSTDKVQSGNSNDSEQSSSFVNLANDNNITPDNES